MHSNLVLPPRLEPTEYTGVGRASRVDLPQDLERRGCMEGGLGLAEPHLDAERARRIRLEAALVAEGRAARSGEHGNPPCNRHVRLSDRVPHLELSLQGSLALSRLCDEKDTARLTIQAMTEREERAGSCVEQKPDERVPVVARGWMDGEKRRFVYREKEVVFVEDADVPRNGNVVPRRPPKQDELLGVHPVVGTERLSARIEGALLDDSLCPGAARSPELALDEHVESLAFHLGGNTQNGNDRGFVDPGRSIVGHERGAETRHGAYLRHSEGKARRDLGTSRIGERAVVVEGPAMDILFVATELAPFVKVGGLADVTAGLTKALRMFGHKVTIALPRFRGFEEGGLLVARRLTPLRISLGDRSVDVTVCDGRLASQVDLVLVDAPAMFDRPEVYGERGEAYPDNLQRFSVLSRAAAEIARQRAAAGAPFDIVHVHDWPTALVPALLAELRNTTPELRATHSVLTIHNLSYQGAFPKAALPDTGLSWDHFNVDGIEFYGDLNVLKYGIAKADAVTAVSDNYAREIQTPEMGERLDGVLRARARGVVGITNGVDYAVWNPATDAALAARYDAEDLTNRARCRGALQRELGLSLDSAAPIVASVGRLVEQKGADVLAAAVPRILRSSNAQFVVAGDGDPALISRLEEAASKSGGRAVFVRAASEALVHRILAGADIVVLPSRHEPCGLVQMYAQRYGAVPVANATGGIVDTVVDCDGKLETGTGFLFEGVTVDGLVGGVERAIAARATPGWAGLMRRVMRLDRGWERPTRRYEQIYRSLA